jgi:opacity protein-like surface antigen
MRSTVSLHTAGLLLASGLTLAAPATAQVAADDSRWYLTLNGGWSGLRDASATLQPPTGASTTGDLKMGSGYLIGGSIGYRIDPSWRIEGELAYRTNGVDTTTVAGLDAKQNDGDLASLAFMFNGFYDFEGWQTSFAHFRPFVGAGLGWAQEIDTDLTIGGVSREFSGNRFAYQLLAGVNWYYRSGWFAGARLKWFDAGSVDLDASLASLGKLKVDYSGMSAELSLGYRF